MPAQGDYDDIANATVSLAGGPVTVSYLIGQIRPGRCDIYTREAGSPNWNYENPNANPPSKEVFTLSPDGAALKGGRIGVGFKIVLLKDGGEYHAECTLAQNGGPVTDGKVVFDDKGAKSVVWLWATFNVKGDA
jgi:hypothetical protein